MSRRRRTIAQRLLEATQSTAMLTTFNEIDMSAIMDIRKRHNEEFQKRYGIKLGFMSFFVKASIRAHGQRTPAEITMLDEGDEDGHSPYRFGLISGWRRLRALSELYEETGEVRFATIKALMQPEAEAAASYVAMVEENEIRAALSYYERARLVADQHQLRADAGAEDPLAGVRGRGHEGGPHAASLRLADLAHDPRLGHEREGPRGGDRRLDRARLHAVLHPAAHPRAWPRRV